jgi:hypothetical protein
MVHRLLLLALLIRDTMMLLVLQMLDTPIPAHPNMLRINLTPLVFFVFVAGFLLGLESIMAVIKEAVRYSKSSKDAMDMHEIALLETRRDVVDLSVFMKNMPPQREPSTQDYLAALRLAPDASTSIKWPITRYEKHILRAS